MKISNHQISANGEQVISLIYANLSKDVNISTVTKEHKGSNGYMSQDENSYQVFINFNLEDNEFEYVLINQLLHCAQIDKGIPILIPVNQADHGAKLMAPMLNSLISDIDAEEQQKNLGFKSEVLEKEKVSLALSNYEKYGNDEHYKELYTAIGAFDLVFLKKNTSDAESFLKLYAIHKQNNPIITEVADTILEILEKYGYTTPQEQVASMRRIVIKIGWRSRFKIYYNGSLQDI